MELRRECEHLARPKGRSPAYALRLYCNGALVFDSAWVAITLEDAQAADWLARLVEDACRSGSLVPPPGRRSHRSTLAWDGDPDDDTSAVAAGREARAEHLDGPRRGGRWCCAVSPGFHSGDYAGLLVRSGLAARWLCEQVVALPAPVTPG
ncbi:hypothetical protein [Tahibacter amnicola]|uniref:Uncharacterized protein n=1 Tax=Tahibacter amnicola TaxID=2976241 RepID=A0ABY6BKW7_9GAMM|nr:hypothetical protein [Tahibacter amnicola]UXI70117.1 hypothetical protein N4264_10950 [Tahibacter amnicola]